ncbi:uncharacterized protein LOC109821691 [Asparagus officinalis]|uniref:uncharacterized protein LOC109821691 n=1 Tax=Asparagus officinalis TaxID=4686 RepID=UPI00098E160E|nr:uncharacterized protein LOC109821691 [Asparagus officinalis]
MSGGASGSASARAVRLFDAHCHLQDRRISAASVPQLIRTSLDSGVLRFAVNGLSEKDWHLVKQMGEEYPSVIPNFGLHPWYITERSANWLDSLKEFLKTTPAAAIGETGLDKGSKGKKIEFSEQIDVFRKQLELGMELERPVSIHCVRAFGDLLEVLKDTGPFPAGVILHSYLGSAEMVSPLSNLGAYFSFSGYLTSMKSTKAKKMLKAVPMDRILLETDAPDGCPKLETDSLLTLPMEESISQERQGDSASDASPSPKEELNHPANIRTVRCFGCLYISFNFAFFVRNLLVTLLPLFYYFCIIYKLAG